MQKTLPITTPPVIGYLHHAYPLSILANWDAYLPWFYCNYIQLFCPRNLQSVGQNRTMKFNFYRRPDQRISFSPYLDVQLLDRELIFRSHEDIVPFLTNCLDKDIYVQPTVDEIFLPDSPSYQTRHFIHETLIYGYDQINQNFTGIGYKKNGDYGSYCISFAELKQAILQTNLKGHYDTHGLRLFKYAPEGKYDFDLQLVTEQIDAYLKSHNTSQQFRMISNPVDGAYGLDTYECLRDYIKGFLSHPSFFDIRPIHILWEHKQCMLARLNFMETKGYLDPKDTFSTSYQRLAQKTGMMRMMMLKFQKTRSTELIQRICSGLDQLKEEERVLLQNVLEQLHFHGSY